MNKTKGIIYMVVSAFCFSIMQIAVKEGADVLTVFQQVFFRNFLLLLFSIIALKKNHKPVMPIKKHRIPLFFRGFFGLLGVVLYFYATQNMPAANASILQKSSPFFVMIFSHLYLNEKMQKFHIFSLAAAFIGAVLVANPTLSYDFLPSLAGIASAFFAAIAYTIIGGLSNKEDPMRVMLSFGLVTCVFILPFLLGDFKIPNIKGWICLIVIGLSGGLGQYFLTIAYQNAPAGEVSIYNYTSVIFSAVLAYFYLRETINLREAVGILIILITAVAMYVYNRRKINLQKSKKVLDNRDFE